MEIVWTDEALRDLEDILAYHHLQAGPATANAVQGRIVAEVEGLRTFPERIRASDRVPGARELVVRRLPYVVFVKVLANEVVVLNLVHTARRFPA
ncbi:MAG: type II toxin-antitoxin system RelE/ParE family toxin [Proteobacteria bacterium]|nr:type II toxin-antitoxin system RelE/ParE family toxin [Pseudomonadota bacterium]MBS0551644.1 type II toxin-antitoxin system RelE/ParE family toxin [Pseudomonadota bacterium]